MKAEQTLELFPVDHAESASLRIERKCWARGYSTIAGVDEAGRGCLCGPVVAAAVILPIEHQIPGVKDSKKLTHTTRVELAEIIREEAIAVATGSCSPQEIDQLNILQAALEAMRRAVLALNTEPDHLLIDGNVCFSNPPVKIQTVIKGDARSHSIAAASIIAKTSRDAAMQKLHAENPMYGWDTNMGYPTQAHYQAIAQFGLTAHHRRSFRLYS
ncbi:MAG: ribonuclease HII [Bacteroidetes bacterium]|nr:ribonuclease HII [Bacteroidota bacterium]MCH8245277.1 ribonuclease HII [Bacteroidota bacterium]